MLSSVNRKGLLAMERTKERLAVVPVAPEPATWAVTLTIKLPDSAGVPERTPPVLRVSPSGRPSAVQVRAFAGSYPVAVRVVEG